MFPAGIVGMQRGAVVRYTELASKPVSTAASAAETLIFGTAGTSGRTNEERLETFRKNRSAIERLVRHKYLSWPVEEIEAVLIKSEDVPKLIKETTQQAFEGS
jgi:hypothetical protein